jgi:hypothetical protein
LGYPRSNWLQENSIPMWKWGNLRRYYNNPHKGMYNRSVVRQCDSSHPRPTPSTLDAARCGNLSFYTFNRIQHQPINAHHFPPGESTPIHGAAAALNLPQLGSSKNNLPILFLSAPANYQNAPVLGWHGNSKHEKLKGPPGHVESSASQFFPRRTAENMQQARNTTSKQVL